MDTKKQLSKREKKLLILAGTGGAIGIIIGALLNIIGGGLDSQHLVLQALSLTAAQAGAIWITSFYPIPSKEEQISMPRRPVVTIAVGLVSLLMGYLLSLLVLNAHNSALIWVGPFIGCTPSLLFRIIEVRQTGRKEKQPACERRDRRNLVRRKRKV